MSAAISREAARQIGAAAKWLMPASREDWLAAMLSDLHYIASDRQALRWACGCLRVSVNERLKTMIRSNDAGSSFLWMAEMATCFLPATVAWLLFMIDFGRAPSGQTAFLVLAMLGVVGPIGLASSLFLAARKRAISRLLGGVLLGGSLLFAIALIAAFAGPELASSLTVLRDAALIGVLPALGAARLLLRARKSSLALA